MLRRLDTKYGWIVTDMAAEHWFSIFNEDTLKHEYTLHRSRRLKTVVAKQVIPAIRAVSGMQTTPSPPKVFVVRKDGIINSCSETMLKWGKWNKEELIGTKFASICDEFVCFQNLISGKSECACSQYATFTHHNEKHRLYVNAFPMSDGTNKHAHTMFLLKEEF